MYRPGLYQSILVLASMIFTIVILALAILGIIPIGSILPIYQRMIMKVIFGIVIVHNILDVIMGIMYIRMTHGYKIKRFFERKKLTTSDEVYSDYEETDDDEPL